MMTVTKGREGPQRELGGPRNKLGGPPKELGGPLRKQERPQRGPLPKNNDLTNHYNHYMSTSLNENCHDIS